MTTKELIAFGEKLKAKGRSPSEIQLALKSKVSNEKQLNKVLKQVFIENKQTVKRSPERIKTLLKANKLKLNFEYALKGLYAISIVVFVVGGVTYGLSSEEVNQNEVFGWFTLIQGFSITLVFVWVKHFGRHSLLLPALIVYLFIWLVELVFYGFPNDLLEAYNHHYVNYPPSFKIRSNTAVARGLGFIFPILYVGMKLSIGWLLFLSYRSYAKYKALSQADKDELNHF